MISVSVNNTPRSLTSASLLELLDTLQADRQGAPFAVALNGDFVPRSRYAEIELKNGDALDIVSPVGGG